jgi:hypothetical protein
MFKPGDKVEHTQGQGVIVYGPFEGISGYEPRYLVRKDDGKHFTGGESYLTAVPKFKEGQVVRARYVDGLLKVVAGPFTWRGTKNPYYVLEYPEGDHVSEDEVDILPVVE